MKALHIDPFSGASGNMFLGALADLGVQKKFFDERIEELGLAGLVALDFTRVSRHGIGATHAVVRLLEKDPPERPYRTIARMIDSSQLAAPSRELAGNIFRILAEAEATIHGTAVQEVHFHEIGALDSIADITLTAAGILELGAQRVTSGRPALGSGTARSRHGTIPVPAPATLEILRGVLVASGPGTRELTTPTGAAILKAVVQEWTSELTIRPERIGYGAGDDLAEHPNILRLVLGEAADEPGRPAQRVCEIECNLDDMTPEEVGAVLERLGGLALDAWVETIAMKKGRPAFKLSALAEGSAAEALIGEMLAATTTGGVRFAWKERRALAREVRPIETSLGTLRVKVFTEGGRIVKWKPEFEDLRSLAGKHGIPVHKANRLVGREIEGRLEG